MFVPDLLPRLRKHYADFHGSISFDHIKIDAVIKTNNDNKCVFVVMSLLFDAAGSGQTSFTTLKDVCTNSKLPIHGIINEDVVAKVKRAGILVESCEDFNETVQYRFSFDPADTTIVVYENPETGILPVLIANLRQAYNAKPSTASQAAHDHMCASMIIGNLQNEAAECGRSFYKTFKRVFVDNNPNNTLCLKYEPYIINDAALKLVTDTGIRVETETNFDGVVHYLFSFDPTQPAPPAEAVTAAVS